MKSRLTKMSIVFLLIVSLCSYTSPSVYLVDCQKVFASALSEETKDPNAAYKKYFLVCNSCEEDILLVQKAYVNVGKLTQRYVNRSLMKDACQYYKQGLLSADTWHSYIKWYSTIGEDQLRQLRERMPGQIENALFQVADVIKKRGLRPNDCPEEEVDFGQLLVIYSDVKVEFLSPKNVDTWLEFLTMRKSDHTWGPPLPLTSWLGPNEVVPPWCEHDANLFVIRLDEWLTVKTTLTPAQRKMYTQKLNQLRKSL